eukprot:g2829.t1
MGRNNSNPNSLKSKEQSNVILGRGRYGIVRQWRSLNTGERVAIKSVDLEQDIGSSRSALRILRNEMCILRLLSRLNGLPESIVRLSEVYENSSTIHMVLPPLSRHFFSLFDLLVEMGRVQEDTARNIAKSLLEALLFLHYNGLVHRDIRPENIIFKEKHSERSQKNTEQGGRHGDESSHELEKDRIVRRLTPMISEFGLAGTVTQFRRVREAKLKQTKDAIEKIHEMKKRQEDITTVKFPTCILVGTPGYIAPECCLNQEAVRAGGWPLYTPACDIYALGVVLFYMMVGYQPFLSLSAKETLQLTRRGGTKFYSQDWAKVRDGRIQVLVQSMMRVDCQERISAKEALATSWILDEDVQ